MKTTTTQERTGRVGQRREVAIPREIFEALKLREGDLVAFAKQGNGFLVKPKRVADRDEHTLAERRAIDRGIAQSEKEYRQGKNAGPFNTAQDFLADLHRESAKLDAKKRKRSVK
jgi:bifunctional DNA-binding transcriptional regulator/antitoxin component of YhaV-PrlF toxin-antitoxin module